MALHDDVTPTAPLCARGIINEGPVEVSRGATLGLDGEGDSTRIDCPRGSLTITVYPDRRVVWSFAPSSPLDPAPGVQSGGDICWRWGRLTRTGREGLALQRILEHLGLGLRRVEREVRVTTGYVDGTE